MRYVKDVEKGTIHECKDGGCDVNEIKTREYSDNLSLLMNTSDGQSARPNLCQWCFSPPPKKE